MHRGEREASDPVSLMRSRYAAFARGEVAYLWHTLAADHPDRARPRDDVLHALREHCRRMRFMGLTILDDAPPDSLGAARVLFAARVFEAGRDHSFVEASEFVHDGTGWRYRSGVMRTARALGVDASGGTLERFDALTSAADDTRARR